MEVAAVMALASGAVDLIEEIYADLSAADQAKYAARKAAVVGNVRSANDAWVAAGGVPLASGAPTQLPGS